MLLYLYANINISMILNIANYKFDIIISEYDDVKEIYIGSATRPCLIFLIYNNNTIILQDLIYHNKY